MDLIKEDFNVLTIVELLQNVWCYSDAIAEKGERTLEFYFNYRQWCEELLFEKCYYNELPGCNFVLIKIKERKSLYPPGASANEENYWKFLRGVKNVNRNVLDKLSTIN